MQCMVWLYRLLMTWASIDGLWCMAAHASMVSETFTAVLIVNALMRLER